MATSNPARNYYEILGIARGAEAGEVRAAFKSAVLKFRDRPDGGEETRRINVAYRALSDPERRREYDSKLAGRGKPSNPEATLVAATPAAAGHDEIEPPRSPDDGVEDRPSRRKGLATAVATLAAGALVVGALSVGLPQRNPSLPEPSGPPQAQGPGFAPSVPLAASPQPTIERPLERPDEIISPVGANSLAADPVPADAGVSVSDGSRDRPAASATPSAPVNSPPAPPPTTVAAKAETVPLEPVRRPQADAPVQDRSAPARFLSGGLLDSDNRGGRFEGTVGVRIAVGASGRPNGCRVTRSSGNAALDSSTCRLLEERLEFAPARDRSGAATASVVESTHVWGRRRR